MSGRIFWYSSNTGNHEWMPVTDLDMIDGYDIKMYPGSQEFLIEVSM